MNSLIEMLSYGFMVRALIAGILISGAAALVGTPLVLRKNSMLGDGLSHVAFGAFAVAVVMGLAPIPVAIPMTIIASFLILRLGEKAGDAAIAVMSSGALAVGTFIVSLAGANVDINSYLFGSILAVSEGEMILAAGLLATITLIYVLFHNKIFALTFDEKFARAIGIKTGVYNAMFAILCSVVVVLGMRLMGTLLISSLIIFPALTARVIFRSFRGVTIFGVIVAVINFMIGLIISYLLETPTGATVVIVSLGVLGIVKILGRIVK